MNRHVDAWMVKKIRGNSLKSTPLSPDEIEKYQLVKLQENILFASQNSKFYNNLYRDIILNKIDSTDDIDKIPLISDKDIIKNPLGFVCVPMGDVSRIVTLSTSGTTNSPKRIYFTAEDQELTRDYFDHGMRTMIKQDDTLLILLPAQSPGCVGDLLKDGVLRFGANVIPYGLPDDYEKVLNLIVSQNVTSIVAAPVSALALCEAGRALGLDIKLKSVLLSADYVPLSLTGRLSDVWGCRVFEHYGMTEMGLGGGIFCNALRGYHMREADMYFEIISPGGKRVPDGEYGEIVFSTLTRRAMPLIRYRTGDIGRFIKGGCVCKTPLKTLERVQGRISEDASAAGLPLRITELDECIFSIDGVADYIPRYENDILYIEMFIPKAELFSPDKLELTKKKLEAILLLSTTKIEVKPTNILPSPVSALRKRKIETNKKRA